MTQAALEGAGRHTTSVVCPYVREDDAGRAVPTRRITSDWISWHRAQAAFLALPLASTCISVTMAVCGMFKGSKSMRSRLFR